MPAMPVPYKPSPTTVALENGIARDLNEVLYPLLGGQSKAADQTRVKQQTLSDYANISHLASINLAVLADLYVQMQRLKHDFGEPMPQTAPVLSIFAQHFGYDIVRLADPKQPEGWLSAIGDLSLELANITSAVTASMENDGRVTPDEVIQHKMLDRISSLISQASGLQSLILKAIASREAAIASR